MSESREVFEWPSASAGAPLMPRVGEASGRFEAQAGVAEGGVAVQGEAVGSVDGGWGGLTAPASTEVSTDVPAQSEAGGQVQSEAGGQVESETGGQVESETGGRNDEQSPAEPVVEVPEDSDRFDDDTTVADEKVAVGPDGSVVDTRGEDTKLNLAEGHQITVQKDGTVVIDGPERLESDRSEIRGNMKVELDDGTTIDANDAGVTVTTKDGETYTINRDGTVTVDLPEATDGEPGEGEPGEGEPGEGEPGEGEPGEEGPGEEGPGEEGPGGDIPEVETPETGTGSSGSGGAGSGGGSTGSGGGSTDSGGTGSTGSGDTGSGDTESGDTESGDTGSGDSGSSDTGSTDPSDTGSTGDSVKIDTELMRKHATAWDGHADDMLAVTTQISGLGIEAIDFGAAHSLHEGYETLRTTLGGLTESGAQQFTTYAEHVRESARNYDEMERNNVDAAQRMI